MGAVKSCCSKQIDEKLMVAKLDLSHCGCLEVPHIVFNAERCIETLILASNQITSLPPQLFHCQEMKHLNINDNCLNSIPPAIGSFINLVSLKLDKNNLQELPENLKMCKKLKRLSLNNNPWKQMPNIVTQIISLEELYMNDCELNYLPASVGRLAKLKIIELRNNNLCNLPLSMTRLENLTRLDISDNEFNEFPNCITKLKSLTELLLDNNDIEEITDIKNLVHLEHLDASYNHLLVISETIGCCTLLNMLNLSFNYIEQLPNSIGNITHLQTLHLEMNELTEIPKSVGKLSHLEELNLCNNKLYSLPNTIGLLRNLRNLNVSRNMIEEFPPEIGSCTKLAIINAAYNRLQVLPSEIGYLNNLKVLDLVGNFLMYLPITIINLRGLRAIWLSANQNVPLIPFTEDLNIASGERFLTNIALPQVGEIPLRNANSTIQKDLGNEKSSSWNKKIRFAEDEEILPGKLHRTPTPFPKELRSPNRKHHRSEEPKPCDNYVNVVDGKVAEQEVSLLQPPSVPVTKTGSGLLNYSESCVTRIREANIRRKNREGFELPAQDSQEFHEHHDTVNNEHEYPCVSEPDKKESQVPVQMETLPEPPRTDVSLTMEQTSKTQLPAENRELTQEKTYSSGLPQVMFDNSTNYNNENWSPKSSGSPERFPSQLDNSYRQQVIYSNLVNNGNSGEDSRCQEEGLVMEPQKIREMYHNDVIYESNMNRPIYNDSRTPSRTDYYNANVEPQSKYFCTNSTNYRDNHFIRTASLNANHDECRRVYSTPPPPPPPTAPFNCNAGGECDRLNGPPPPPPPPLPPPNVNPSECSSQDLAALAEQMKNRKIAPPCYEIAKMYSTKAALFENQLKTN